MFQGCLQRLPSAAMCLVSGGQALDGLDKHAPGSTPTSTNGQACGCLRLKGQALVSPGLLPPRDTPGGWAPWRLSLPEDGVHGWLA